jgi:hypothetical protein
MTTIHALRIIASFALLGAVLTGITVGWLHGLSFDPRWIGAAIGAVAGLTIAMAVARKPRETRREVAHSL